MSWIWIIVILLIGLALVALEIVALPGGVSGICGGVMAAIGIWQAYANHGTTAGNIVLLSSLVVVAVMLAILMKSRTWRHFSLNEESDSRVNEVEDISIGARGKTISRLAPAGKAMFGSEIVEVHSIGDFIDEGVTVEVVEKEGYRITVKRTE